VLKRQFLLIAACILLTALALVVPSSFARLVLGALMLLSALVWALTLLTTRQSINSRSASVESVDQVNSSETLAISSLLEATMSGMREGLLVVNRDMRVVASNPAAHKLFNPAVPALKSQRLTELNVLAESSGSSGGQSGGLQFIQGGHGKVP
jgi:c-di-AMP phosphodiesterase-like protein